MKRKLTEDWLAVWLGLLFFALSLAGLFGADALGWAVTTSVWTRLSTALAPASRVYGFLPGVVSLLVTYLALLAILTPGAKALGADGKRFAVGFTGVFAAAYLSWIAGSWAYIAATPDKRAGFGIGWSLNLTNEGGLHRSAALRPADRQLLPLRGRADEGSDPPGTVHQDRRSCCSAGPWGSLRRSRRAWRVP